MQGCTTRQEGRTRETGGRGLWRVTDYGRRRGRPDCWSVRTRDPCAPGSSEILPSLHRPSRALLRFHRGSLERRRVLQRHLVVFRVGEGQVPGRGDIPGDEFGRTDVSMVPSHLPGDVEFLLPWVSGPGAASVVSASRVGGAGSRQPVLDVPPTLRCPSL